MDDITKTLLGICSILLLGNWGFTFLVWSNLSKLNGEFKELQGYFKGVIQSKGGNTWPNSVNSPE